MRETEHNHAEHSQERADQQAELSVADDVFETSGE